MLAYHLRDPYASIALCSYLEEVVVVELGNLVVLADNEIGVVVVEDAVGTGFRMQGKAHKEEDMDTEADNRQQERSIEDQLVVVPYWVIVVDIACLPLHTPRAT